MARRNVFLMHSHGIFFFYLELNVFVERLVGATD